VTIPFSVAELLVWTGGPLLSGKLETHFANVSIDTRTLKGSSALFVAIRGPNHDAHRFLKQATASGAAGLLVEKGCVLPADLPDALPVVGVEDSTRGLGSLAAGHRRHFDGPVVAITGSNGKTTTKEMCAEIMSLTGPCLKNQGNLNNAYGLPLTLLQREADHRSLVVELGMNHRGEIAPLAKISQPSVGVITNVGTAHVEFLGSRDEIAREKGDLMLVRSQRGRRGTRRAGHLPGRARLHLRPGRPGGTRACPRERARRPYRQQRPGRGRSRPGCRSIPRPGG
jgi:UDP-N-acetylmuramoyl-tripeptide--D-alanyl-D-alanine ligase